jgi:crossover junction endodeoxyribonuclease RuvC
MRAAATVLGVDTSLRSTGVGVVRAEGSRFTALDYGRIVNTARLPLSTCLDRIYRGVAEVVARVQPDAVAIEGIFFCRNVRTAVILGEARGAVIAAAAGAGVPVYEYPPRRVKQAVSAYGAAGKEQVQRMVMTLLGLDRPPPEDASDALAIAFCHLNVVNRVAAATPRPI